MHANTLTSKDQALKNVITNTLEDARLGGDQILGKFHIALRASRICVYEGQNFVADSDAVDVESWLFDRLTEKQ